MTPPESDDRYKWKVLSVVIFGVFMVILDTTVVNVAFPVLRRELGATLHEAQWVVSVYVLALGIATPLAGFLADRFGIKHVYLGGLALFVLGSLLSGLSQSLEMIVAARALQAIGGGLALPLGTTLLYSSWPVHEVGRALGLFGIAIVFAPALGPILGGLFVDAGLWRWIFFINVPIGIVGVTVGLRQLRAVPGLHHARLDLPGLLLSTAGFGAMLYGASIAAEVGWTAPSTLGWLSIGAVGLIAFAIVELRSARDPMLDLDLFENRIFLVASVVGYVAVVALFGAEFLLPIYLQVLRGLDALQTGLIVLPLALAAGIATPLAGRLYDRIGPRPLAVAGYALLVVNTYQLAHITMETSMGYICWLMALRGIALGLTMQTTLTTALGTVPPRRLSRGSSLIAATRFVVQSLGVAALATVLASASPDKQPTLAGFDAAYMWTFYAALVALTLSFLLPGWPQVWTGRGSLRPEEG
jgi:EmrB/QacA subfamily drug resistance transporter